MARTKAFDEKAVLEHARDLFWEKGYAATSIGDLEKYLGISRSSLYQTYGGKRELYDKTLAAYQEENLGRLRKMLANTDDLRGSFENLFSGAILQDAEAGPVRGCYVVNVTTEMASGCAEALRFVSDNRERFVAIMRGAIEAAQRRGQLAPSADSQHLADYLFILYNGLQVVIKTGIDRVALREAVLRGLEALPWQA